MMTRLSQILVLLVTILGLSGLSLADTSTNLVAQSNNRRHVVKKYKPYVTPPNAIDTQWSAAHPSPWDFSGLLGLFNPGFGVGVRAAYRIVDNVVDNIDDSLSVELGLGYIGASNTYGGVNASYSLLEVPILARWDFRINNSKFIVGPEAGFSYLMGSAVTVNGQSYNTPGGSLYFELGGFGMYQFNNNWAGRLNVEFGGYTTLTIGATYFLP